MKLGALFGFGLCGFVTQPMDLWQIQLKIFESFSFDFRESEMNILTESEKTHFAESENH